MSTTLLTPIVATFLVPAAGWAANFVVRKQVFKRFPTSAGGDWLLLLIVFDAAALLSSHDLARLVAWQDLHSQLVAVFFSLFFLTGFAWYVSVAFIESKLEEAFKSAKRKRVTPAERVSVGDLVGRFFSHPVTLLLQSALLLVFFTALHALVFIWTGPQS